MAVERVQNGSSGTYRTPRYLHNPYQVLFFDAEDMALVVFLLILALLFGGVFWLLVVGVPAAIIRTKKRQPRGFVKHIFYRMGFYRFKNAPSAFETKFYE